MSRLALVVALTACGNCVSGGNAPPVVERERLDVERRALFLECLHQYSLGTVLGEDVDYERPAHRRQVVANCAALAGLRVEDVTAPAPSD